MEDNMSWINHKPINEAVKNEKGLWVQDYEVTDSETGEVCIRQFYNDGNDWKEVENKRIDLTKKLGNDSAAVSLKKNTVNLDKCMVKLSKESGINLQRHVARVAVDLDYSGSMRGLYQRGNVQQTISRLLPLALRFDDNGELDTWIFDDEFHRVESMNLGNYKDYIESEIMSQGWTMGGTSYSPVLIDNLKYYFGADDEPKSKKKKSGIIGFISSLFDTDSDKDDEADKYNMEQKIKNISTDKQDVPVFIIFITDGEAFDIESVEIVLDRINTAKMYIQFIGIGDASFNTLEKIHKHNSARKYQNTSFMTVKSLNDMSDDELYDKLLSGYVKWLKSFENN